MFTKLLAGPNANPFKIFHRKRGPLTKRGVSEGYQLTWEYRELPGAGALQYAYETFGLPPDAPYGFGNINVRRPSMVSQPASYVFQSTGVVPNPPISQTQGQFVTQPLMNIGNAETLGIVTPGAVQPAPNMIYNSSPVLSG